MCPYLRFKRLLVAQRHAGSSLPVRYKWYLGHFDHLELW